MNQVKSDMYVELLLIFIKDKSVYFYFFVKASLLSVLVMQNYAREFQLLQIKSELTNSNSSIHYLL